MSVESLTSSLFNWREARRAFAKIAAKTLLLLPIVDARSATLAIEDVAATMNSTRSRELDPPSQSLRPMSVAGPTASSSFLTADFASPKNYSGGGSSQQIISQRLWGDIDRGRRRQSIPYFY